jgi:hypothetical protein
MNRRERRAQASYQTANNRKTNAESQVFFREVVTELCLAAKEARDPDPNNVKNSDAADCIRFINKERLPGGELFGTHLLGIANAMGCLSNGEAFTAEQFGEIMHTNPSEEPTMPAPPGYVYAWMPDTGSFVLVSLRKKKKEEFS